MLQAKMMKSTLTASAKYERQSAKSDVQRRVCLIKPLMRCVYLSMCQAREAICQKRCAEKGVPYKAPDEVCIS